MKKLLVLTDFTANASHAEAAALRIAGKMGAGILLYHSLPYIPMALSDSGGPYVSETANMLFDDSKERLIQEAGELKELADKLDINHLVVNQTNGEGSLGDVITDLTAAPTVAMVVMGGRTGGTMDHLLTGSDTAEVIRKALKPVLIIPRNAAISIPEKVVFATAFNAADIPAINFLQDLSTHLDFDLDIVHIISGVEEAAETGAAMDFRNYLALHGLNYQQVRGKDVHKGLQHYCVKNGADMLAMVHGQHSFISRLFGHSESKAVITDQRLSVLIFPPGFK